MKRRHQKRQMRLSIAELAEELRGWWRTQGNTAQYDFEQTLPERERNRSSRNGHCNGGWCIVGHPGLTMAIRRAKLPLQDYWSGRAPTPSSQAPATLVEYASATALGR